MLRATVDPADVAADALRVRPLASGFGFADPVILPRGGAALAHRM